MNKSYKKIRNNFVRFLVLLFLVQVSCETFAAQVTPLKQISGTVTDSQGNPLIGVNVVEKGSTTGTITDINGKFQLTPNESNPVLVFSYIGFVKQEVQVKPESVIKITMIENQTNLDEVVVVGYGTKRKGGITAAVTTIGNQDISRTTSTTTAGALVGKVAGITSRQKQGTPGSASTLQIRNMGTPLYVIDGIIKDESFFNSIDINDIDNISVLKDGSAAIYGVKAANGVVLVTTKSGKLNQKPQININTYTGWQSWTKYPQLLNAYQWEYANYMRDVNSGTLAVSTDFAKAELEKWKTGLYNPGAGEDYRGFDWKKAYVSDAAPQSYINASISGGSDNTTYYVSLSHVDQDAVFKDYNYNRTNIQSNIEIRPTKKMKIGIQLSGKIENTSNPGLPGSDDYALIKTSLFGLQPIYRPYANDNPLYLNYIVASDSRNMAAFTKEYAGVYSKILRTSQNNFNLEYQLPLKGLSVKGMFSYYYADNNTNNNEKGWQEYTYDRATDTYKIMYDKTASGETYLVRYKENYENITGQATLNYDNTFSVFHHVAAVAGFECYKQNYNALNIQQNPVTNPFIDLISTDDNNKLAEVSHVYSTASFIFRASYDYKQKYIIDFAGRYDGSWKFPENNRWGFFPSISGAWRVSEENFFKNMSVSGWLTNLKLRASYGEMGDDNLGSLYPDFAYQSGYTYNMGSSYMPNDPTTNSANTNIAGSVLKGIPNTGLTWLKTSITDIGLDLGFFNNKLSAEIDVFKRERNGIAAIPNDIIFPLESGLTALAENLNSDMNEGIDGFVKWEDKIGSVKYFVGANITFARQMNGKRYGELFYNALDKYYYSQNNRWANVSNGQVWMWQHIGVFQTQEQIDNYPVNIDGKNNTTLVPGDLIFKDVNNDGIIDNSDKRPLGYASVDWPWDSSKGNKNPLISAGLNFGFEWKGIDLSADFAGGFLNTFVPDWNMKWGTSRSYSGYYYNSFNVWHHEDVFDPTSPWVAGAFPALRANNPSTRNENDFYTKEVNYVRLRNLLVGYTFPKKWLDKVLVQKARVYFEGTNLFCWDTLGLYGIDPETSTVNGSDYPQSRVLTIGLNLTF
ncbi:MAG: TonB-dependent receptor [Paludibacter sp.]|nr:TonB-dependent receptor [Paludibacter sp.]